MRCRVEELRCKEIINICDGRRLGFPADVEMETDTFRVCALVVYGPRKYWIFGRCDEFAIPWECVRRISEDVILVEAEDWKRFLRERRKRSWRKTFGL
jgi:YlmC/YmxH family sporulation protein